MTSLSSLKKSATKITYQKINILSKLTKNFASKVAKRLGTYAFAALSLALIFTKKVKSLRIKDLSLNNLFFLLVIFALFLRKIAQNTLTLAKNLLQTRVKYLALGSKSKALLANIHMNTGPWGPWNSGENKSGNRNSGNKIPNNNNPKPRDAVNIDEITKKVDAFLEKLLGKSGGPGNFNNGGNGKPQKSIIGLVALTVIFLWLASGLFKIDSDENGVVLYFGKMHSIATPGLNYHIPYPFGTVIKESVTNVNTDEFGFSSASKSSDSRNLEAESLMLTGDENIVDIEFQVQWQVNDIKDYIFNVADQRQTIREVAESSMREIIARTPIVDALSDGKKKIEQEVKVLLQQTLDSYGSGVGVVLVQLLRVDPPSQVIDAFRDVQTAKADKEKEINQAQAYSNDIIPRARGLAAQMLQESEAYKQSVAADSEGQASRFVAVYNQYKNAPAVTKKRIYIETMEKIYQANEKILIDKDVSKSGIVPYLPLSEMKSKETTTKTE